MKLTDKDVIKWVGMINLEEFSEDINSYPDSERYGRSDKQFFADELSYFVSIYEEDGHAWNDSLREARRIVNRTRGGKMPLNSHTLEPMYHPIDVEIAKDEISAYNKMKYRLRKLAELGYHGRW